MKRISGNKCSEMKNEMKILISLVAHYDILPCSFGKIQTLTLHRFYIHLIHKYQHIFNLCHLHCKSDCSFYSICLHLNHLHPLLIQKKSKNRSFLSLLFQTLIFQFTSFHSSPTFVL